MLLLLFVLLTAYGWCESHEKYRLVDYPKYLCFTFEIPSNWKVKAYIVPTDSPSFEVDEGIHHLGIYTQMGVPKAKESPEKDAVKMFSPADRKKDYPDAKKLLDGWKTLDKNIKAYVMRWKYTEKGKARILSRTVFFTNRDGCVLIDMITDISSPKDIQEHQRIFKHLLDSIKFR